MPGRFPNEFPENYDPADYSDEQNTRFAYNAYLKKFLRCVKGIDDNLGRLFKHLEETGQMDNTVIIYTGDQGFMLGEHDYQDKRWMYEESMRMPFLVRYPKTVKAGQSFDTIIENVDYAPTMLDFAGAAIPESVQGRSFKSLLETGKEAGEWKKAAYYRYWMHMAHHDNPAHLGIRTKRYKLIYFYGCNYQGGYQTPAGWELYDMKKDPHETRNLYHKPKHAKLAHSLKVWLAKVRKRVGDDGSHYPACEKIVQEFWDYDEADQAKAKKISAEYLARREAELESGLKNPKLPGNPDFISAPPRNFSQGVLFPLTGCAKKIIFKFFMIIKKVLPLVLLIGTSVPAHCKVLKQPNLIVYMIDDLGWNQISAKQATMGTHTGSFITPNIEKIANQGLSFTHAYTQPNCAPSCGHAHRAISCPDKQRCLCGWKLEPKQKTGFHQGGSIIHRPKTK